MKGSIEPTWEHVENRHGGMCSFKIELNKSPIMFEDFCSKMVTGILNNDPDDINGVSVSPKNNWAIVKIWNKSSKNDLSKTLKKDILDKYSELGVRYKPNSPEY
jgi:hypothetical protein